MAYIYGSKFSSTTMADKDIPYMNHQNPHDYNDFLLRTWYQRNIYSSWFKFKDYYKKKLISSKHDNSFGSKSYYTFNGFNTDNILDESKQHSYGQFHYFFHIGDDFPDHNLHNTKIGCATLRDVIIPDYSKANIFIDHIKVDLKKYYHKDEKQYMTTNTFDYRDHYFVDLADVVPSTILTIGTDAYWKPIHKRQVDSSTNSEMTKYFSTRKEIHYLLFIESNSSLKNVMLP
jgi:hypothetical protein